jgi:hypothetical protein
MKKLLSIVTIVVLSAAASFAACGKKVTDAGTLKSIDADSKQVVIETADGKTVKRTLTPETKTTAKDGAAAKAEDLVGKAVSVVSEHNKVDSISAS